MTKKELTRKERERLQRRNEILSIALKLFSEQGFRNVSMQQIAEASEFSVGTLYNFFESKETLFEELINTTGQQVLSEFLEILNEPGSEKDILWAFIMHQPKFLAKHGNILKLYFTEIAAKNLQLSKIHDVNNIHKIIDSRLSEIIEQGIQKGIFRAVDPEIAAKSLGATIETSVFETTENVNNDEVINKFKKVEQLFLEGLLLPKDSHA
ncbi:MAG: TetR/AcrR family transcriptional regulator [Sedimentisphaerales bacterium]|nr:TetR/AcrR family transcriptional regulator [Sedimentisphaerales bacterium]